jgi:hypothetical protein
MNGPAKQAVTHHYDAFSSKAAFFASVFLPVFLLVYLLLLP